MSPLGNRCAKREGVGRAKLQGVSEAGCYVDAASLSGVMGPYIQESRGGKSTVPVHV